MRTGLRFSRKPTTYQAGTVHHVISTGQSLAVGVSADGPVLSDSQPYSNLKFDDWMYELAEHVEPIYRNNPPSANSGESIMAGMANLWSELANSGDPDAHVVLSSQAGWGGAAYAEIKRGGGLPVYSEMLNQVMRARVLCTGTHTVDAIILVHGEADHMDGTAQAVYEAGVAELQDDLETDILAMTGQAGVLPLFTTQIANWTWYDDATSVIPQAQWNASKDNADVHLVAPHYFLPHDVNGLHLTHISYRRLGEYFAKAIWTVVTDEGTWTPLQPATCTRTGAVITLTFDIPGTALVLDDTNVDDPGNYGFEYADNGDGNSVSISSVALAESDTEVDITLSDTPTGTGQVVRYAWTGTPGADGGPTTGPRGCLRDDDASFTSRHGYDLENWCVVFEMDVS